MAGHSKWANIKHKKGAADKKKGKIFSRIAKEIMVAAKMGGGDASANPRLRSALASAKAANMPNANIDRAVKKGLGELGDVVFEEIVYEGYGAEGVAVLIECLTDNRNRSASDVRMTLDRNCGNLAASGAVSWMFHRQAHFVVTGENADEEILMDIVLDAGAEDIEAGDGVADIWGPPECLEAVMEALTEAAVEIEEAGLVRRPENTIVLKNIDKAKQVLRLVDRLEDLDDVQEVTANFEIDDSIADEVAID